jgi:hypothetical protein
LWNCLVLDILQNMLDKTLGGRWGEKFLSTGHTIHSRSFDIYMIGRELMQKEQVFRNLNSVVVPTFVSVPKNDEEDY